MVKLEHITEKKKVSLLGKIKKDVFFYFVPSLLKREIGLKKFILFYRRILHDLSKKKTGKFIKMGESTRMDWNTPGFPSDAFYTACKKFIKEEGKLPCSTARVAVTSIMKLKHGSAEDKYNEGKDVHIQTLMEAIRKLQDQGIAIFEIEGGEPFLDYDRLQKICREIDYRSEKWIYTSGYGVGTDRLLELKRLKVSGVVFTLHSRVERKYNHLYEDDNAWDIMMNAIELCNIAGLPVVINACLHKGDMYNEGFERIMDTALGLQASMVRMVKERPVTGKWGNDFDRYDMDDIKQLKMLVDRYNINPQFTHYPPVTVRIHEDSQDQPGINPERISRFFINSKGYVLPCEFHDVSFGNIGYDSIKALYDSMVAYFNKAGNYLSYEEFSEEIFCIYREAEESAVGKILNPISEVQAEKYIS